ncbi:MAG: DUF1302 domain-containing protein [Panacagrimonas sp.]
MKTKLEKLRRLGAASLAATIPLGAHAFTFEKGSIKGNLDTTISLGTTLSMEDPDDALIGIANGGTARSVNEDDGKLNYKSGDVISTALKATHDLDLQYASSGIFARTTYFYDSQADSDEENFGKRGEDRLVSKIELLDLFAYTNFKINGRNASLRAGRQVVNWGESTFIGNSINVINPIDVAKLRTPGSELKEALLPLPMLWTSTALSSSVSAEALWILGFDEIEIDPRGSFFSTTDLISDDSDTAFVGSGRRNDQHGATPVSATTAGFGIRRATSRQPERKAGQFGFALRYFADWLNNSEFGLYYLKYHSRSPLISGTRATDQTSTLTRVQTSSYFVEYPENIELYGLSFNTDGPAGIALQGEYSYRPNLPVQIASTELLLAALRLPGNTTDVADGVNPALAPGEAEGFRRIHAHQAQATATKAFGPTLGASQFVVVGEAGVTRLELDKDLLFNAPSVHLPSCRNLAPIIAAVANGSCQEGVGGGYADRTSWGYRMVARMDFENVIGPAQFSPRLVFAHDVNGVGPAFNQEAKAVTLGLAVNYLQRWQADISYATFFGGREYSGTDPIPPGTIIPPTPPATAPTVFAGDASQPASFSSNANPNEDRDFLAVSISYAF